MRMAFEKFKTFSNKALKFITDGYSAYPLTSQQCMLNNGWDFDVTQASSLNQLLSLFLNLLIISFL